jgi:eukaryotic-like serine/threonine-protein kinase
LTFTVGDVVAGRYEVLESLGHRPLGWLYRAREREIGVEVALWAIGADMLPDEAARQAFVGKLGRARSLSHANLVRVFGVYPTAEEVVIAAQWAPGQTLYARVQTKPFTPDEARPVLAQVAAAMTHAHQHGVVLGDVHAATVVLLGAGVKLSNIGLATALPRKRFLESVRDSQGYLRLPPELRSGMTCDTRADVYSLAMLAVEMLTGGVDRTAIKGSDPLKTVLARALSTDAMVRHTSVDALEHELDAALSGQAPRPRRPTPPIGVPIAPPGRDRVEDSTGPVPRADEVRPPSQETTRSIDPEELELLKGDQVTRQVPLHELLPLRAASSETQQVPLEEMLVDDVESSYDELTLEQPPPPMQAPPPSSSSDEHDLKTDQVHLLEPEAVKTTEHPRLPPPVIEDDIDTQRVTRADVHELVAAEETAAEREEPYDPNATPLPPPMPQSAIMTPGPMPTPSQSLADSRDAPTKVEGREPKIEISVELPVIDVVATPPPSEPKLQPLPKDEPLYDGDEAPTRAMLPDGAERTDDDHRPHAPLPPPAAAAPLPPPAPSAPLAVAPSAPSNVPTPIAPSPSARRRRNPFEPVPPEEDARTTEHRSPPPRARKNPFDAAPPARSPAPASAVGSGTLVDKRRPKPRPTILVPPIGKKSTAAPILLVALAAFIAAVGVALAISHYLTEQRLEQERRDKQRLADELNVQAEAMRRQQTAQPDGGVKAATPPIVTHPETLLPRQGACPLGAHLVSTGGHSFCVDVYEYPGGNTIPRSNISFADAGRICMLRGERLCTEGEWERACRGKGNASYPYGQAFDATRCNTKGTGGEAARGGTFTGCKSAAGAYDMSGNVAEWVSSGAQKGGNAKEGAKESRCSAVTRGAPAAGGSLVGFRCCADPTAKR